MNNLIDQLGLPDLEKSYGLPSGLLAAVMQTESNGNPNAVSPSGAQGLFQFMPETAKQYGIDPLDPRQAANGAARYYADLLKANNGNLDNALASYNFGPGNVASGKPLPKETQDYITKVKGLLPTQVADSGQIATDANIDNRPSLDDIFSRPSLDDIFSNSNNKPQNSKDNTAKYPKNNADIFDTVSDNALQGATLGLGNRASAGLAALVESGINGESLADNYKKAREIGYQRISDEVTQNPLTAILANIGGSLATGGLGANTEAGSAIANSLRSGGTAARIAKGAIAGSVSGAAYGAGTASYDQSEQGARQGAISGALVGGAIPAVGATLSDVGNTVANSVKGTFAAGPEAVRNTADSLKEAGGDLYNKMRDLGATFKTSATQGFLQPDIEKTLDKLNFIPGLTPQTNAIVSDLKNKISTGDLGLDQLDQYRRQLGRVGGNAEEPVAAGAVRKVIDNFVNNANSSHLSADGKDAIDLLNQGRKQYQQASKFEDISNIVSRADGDPNKVKSGLKRFLLSNDNKPSGWSDSEIKALNDAASSTGTEKLLKTFGKFGIDLGSPLNVGNTIGPVVGYRVGGGAFPIVGTAARYAQKLSAKGSTDNLLKVLQNGNVATANSNSSISPLLSLVASQQAGSLSQQSPLRIGLKKMKVK